MTTNMTERRAAQDDKTMRIDNRLRALMDEHPTVEQLRHVVVVLAEEMRRLGKPDECAALRKAVGA